MVNRLIVVSNRLPLTLRRSAEGWVPQRSSGGLATAVTPLLQKQGGLWIGWPGETAGIEPRERASILEQWAREQQCVAVDLPPDVADGFYRGYANQTLWPVFHYFPSRLKFEPRAWESYVEANRLFCRAVTESYRPGDLVWVHDYHLMLLPQMVREEIPEAAIGFFLHIPFPSNEVFPIVPHREELLQGLLGADLLGFQTHGHLQQFRSSLLRVLGVESGISEAGVGSRPVRLEALPIGIAPREYTDLLERGENTARYARDWAANYRGQKVLLAVDRLDYTKGLPERMRAFARLLESSSEWKGRVTLIQVAVPSRGDIESYQDLRTEVNQLVGEVNGRFGTPGWMPVVYINRSIERDELVALYSLADVCWVGPLRDGMNLVAKEYVACQAAGKGVLVLSEFAGAAAEMGEALMINPFDEERTAGALLRALGLDERERSERMGALHSRVLRNDVFRWGESFVAALEQSVAARGRNSETRPRRLPGAEVRAAYAEAARRLVVLDYDGTLVPHAPTPQEAVPPRGLIAVLAELAADPANCLALVSGRRARDLEQWFGAVRGLWLAAEHGAEWKAPGEAWQEVRPQASTEWKAAVAPILDHFADRTPGSFVEEKKYALAWHYRRADAEFGAWLSNEMVANLEAMLAETELRAFPGEKVVEVRPVWANKGEIWDRLLAGRPRADFLFAAGNDRTDEDIFARMPEGSWSVHVGSGPTRAAYTLRDPVGVRILLESFARSARPVTP